MQTNVEGALWADNFERNSPMCWRCRAMWHRDRPRNPGGIKPAGSHGTLAQPVVVPEAYEAYLKGRYEASAHAGGLPRRAGIFQSAADKDQPLPLLMRALP